MIRAKNYETVSKLSAVSDRLYLWRFIGFYCSITFCVFWIKITLE